ncbi:MAG TPA: glycine zipper domain-containing protein [Geobacteraceae bacterium]|nr:glycine zipper domain-containing protein [Geobacteraceae bacterium]
MKRGTENARLKKPAMHGVAAAVIAAMVAAGTVFAQEPYVYPNQGQSSDKMEKDKYSCYKWAKGQTGFDPMQAPTASSPPPPTRGGAVRGAAGGAAAGAAIGAIAGNAGKGAAIGAASGGLIGGARRRQSQKEQEQWSQQQSAEYGQRRGEYNRAWGACMEGKGYTVK